MFHQNNFHCPSFSATPCHAHNHVRTNVAASVKYPYPHLPQKLKVEDQVDGFGLVCFDCLCKGEGNVIDRTRASFSNNSTNRIENVQAECYLQLERRFWFRFQSNAWSVPVRCILQAQVKVSVLVFAMPIIESCSI